MKFKSFNYFAVLAVALLVTLFSCSNDDNNPDPGPVGSGTGTGTGTGSGGNTSGETVDLNGNLSEDRTLDATKTYSLKGTYSVDAGVTLTIPAGTRIVSDRGVENYILINQGAKIDVQGTAAAPVVMTSANTTPGDWGGLIIAGNATTTEGIDVKAEVGSIPYGGTDDADNSGTINHLIINYAGAQINANSQFNGLTLYAVGSGTSISNVGILNGTDDGVEFFGGTVSPSNFYIENNEDDAIDWTEGWNGTLTNTYVLHTVAGFSTVVEADKINGNPKLVNLTAVSTVGGTALQFKKESGATITGLSLTNYVTSIDMPDNGPLSNIKIDGADADPSLTYLAPATVDIADFSWVNSGLNVQTQALPSSITTDTSLDANIIYNLNGNLSVEAGATLTIPAGTVIIAQAAEAATDTFIVIQRGAKIDVQGTKEAPVVMTSSNQNPGDWGGLVILGDATTTEGLNATAEVGGLEYGGTNDEDNSGTIKYLVINYAGAQINSESQFNGLTLYAVGSGTTIDNVALLNGTDDGVEFFGGTVNASNFYLENNEDDAIDWTEGWNGTLTNAYVSHTKAGFSTVVEADGINGNPKLINLTAISTVDGTALQFKKESGATIANLYLEGYVNLVDMVNGGPIENVKIDGSDATVEGPYTSGVKVDIATFGWATGN